MIKPNGCPERLIAAGLAYDELHLRLGDLRDAIRRVERLLLDDRQRHRRRCRHRDAEATRVRAGLGWRDRTGQFPRGANRMFDDHAAVRGVAVADRVDTTGTVLAMLLEHAMRNRDPRDHALFIA
jgi:hypothetical protein